MPQWSRPPRLMVVLVCLSALHCGASAVPPYDQPSQGWSPAQRVAWYTASQGSRLVPQVWLHALEQPDAAAPFLDPGYIARFRYLPSPVADWQSPGCPYDQKLPLGFTVDCQSDNDFSVTRLRWATGQSAREPWVGLNCSACHTAQLSYKGAQIRVDGGPTLADFQSFTEALQRALANTASDPAKFARFAAAIPNADQAKLATALAQLVAWQGSLARLNDTPGYRYGFGRLDAIGHIYNKVALEAMADNADAQTANPADAPVSYPFLWNVPQLDRVEWNGIAPNSRIGSAPSHDFNYGGLGRNAGEVIGVFGDIVVKSKPGLSGYVSSVDEQALSEMENQLGTLQPPTWPAAFPPIDQALADAGGVLFAARCSSCHAVPAIPLSLAEPYKTTLQLAFSSKPDDKPVGTDIWMACNAVFDQAQTGAFAGNPTEFFGSAPFGAQSASFTMVQNAVAGALLGHKVALVGSALSDLFGFDEGLPEPTEGGGARGPDHRELLAAVSPKQKRRLQCQDATGEQAAKVVYKGRPLQGIWATAPYLHNGSVPTLYDLLLPAAQRPAVFYTGSREFDPVRVGLQTAASADNSFKFIARDADGPKDGDSNAGHDYGNASLSDGDRRALIEYMKRL